LPVSALEAVQVAAVRVKARKMAQAQAEAKASRPIPYADDPVGFITERLGEFIWSKQQEIAQSVVVNRRTAVQSCHNAGKSYIAARLVAWWLESHPPGEAFVVTTAPTAVQVEAILWREINRAHSVGKLSGRTNNTEWIMRMPAGHEELVAYGRKPSDYNPTAFQGIHARYVLVVLDEACGVPDSIYDAATSLTSNEHGRILAIGNPDDPSSRFAKVCAPDSGWHVIRVDALESPNFTPEGKDVPPRLLEMLIGPTYVEESARDWGEDSPLYQSKVRGMFPEIAEDVVVQLSFIRKCQQDRQLAPHMLLPVELGVDVGGGKDRTCIRERRGAQVGRRWTYSTPDPKSAAGYVLGAIRESGATRVKIDSIGIGWALAGWLDAMRIEGLHRAEIVPVNVATESTDPMRFPNLRSQLWWQIGREATQRGLLDLRGLDEATVAQLIAVKSKPPDAHNRTIIEKKDETRKRIKRSPDDADAFLLAWYSPPAKTESAAAGSRPMVERYVPR
jgi:hypothetical protein